MTDKELQLIVLQKYYEHRKEGLIPINKEYFGIEISREDVLRISEQLQELDWIEFKPLKGNDRIQGGWGRIMAKGIAEIEGDTKPPQVVHTGGGTYIGGNVETGGGKFVGRDDYSTSGLTGDEIAKLFEAIYQRIDDRPDTPPEDKADLKSEVQELQTEVAKGEQADAGFLTRRLRNIARIAPDIRDVIVQTLGNPVKGIAEVVRKVLAKAKK